MLKIGITGGIGSGKTTCCKIFECFEIPVFYADLEAKKLMTHKPEVKEKIKSLFGKNSYKEGQLSRKFIAQKVFNNKKLLSKLNSIVHPAVHHASEEWFNKQSDMTYALYEAALIFETGSQDRFDYVITVIAPKKMRIQRVAIRDQVSKRSVADRMNNQMSQWDKLKLSDYQIRNNGKKMILPQIISIHEDLLSKTLAK